MDTSLFFCDLEKTDKNAYLIDQLALYSDENAKQIYFISAPLGESKDKYDYNDAAVLLMPKHKICFINFDEVQGDSFDFFCDDFVEDIGYLSEKYEYRGEIGRPRAWRDKLIEKRNNSEIKDIESMLNSLRVTDRNDERCVDYLISLSIGSINDIGRIGGAIPETVLDQVKKKIILFDGDQSRFIYTPINKKRVTIQGMAGTGKTELLLHKLRDLYINKKEKKIVFTCHNVILADSMTKRIPEFFNFMRVEEQIEWNKRLWVMRGWGSEKDPNSGIYSYICNLYDIPFHGYSYEWSFDNVCREAVALIEKRENKEPCFDYILIDESQDFSESFIKLCELVTRTRVYVAGDIFQDIYDHSLKEAVDSDFLLNKCYRTDPKTLMFAHALGMGLYEKPVIRWLEDAEWNACGYSLSRTNGNVRLARAPLRRFEDLTTGNVENISVHEAENNIPQKVLSIIEEIRGDHPTVCPQDVAIVFLDGNKSNYELADILSMLIRKKFNYKTIKGYETKENTRDALFISNNNNIKGLEFSFVICIVNSEISTGLRMRNSLYMMLTRSFITSYLIINNNKSWCDNAKFIKIYKDAAEKIQRNGFMDIQEPSDEEKAMLRNKISITFRKKRSIIEIVNGELSQYPQISNAAKKNILSNVIDARNRNDGMTDDDIANSTNELARVQMKMLGYK